MGMLRRLDLVALTASGSASKELHAFLKGLREDAASAIAGATTVFHKNTDTTEKNANATDLPTALVLVNSLKSRSNAHLASNGIQGAHMAASAATTTAATATDLATAQTLANEIKADFNTHLVESGVHLQNDGTNTVAAANATDLSTLLTLVNQVKTKYNTHIASVMSTPMIEI